MQPGAGRDFGLSNTQARALAGKAWRVDGTCYQFSGFDPKTPGQPPWKSGAEGKAFPLRGADGEPAAYLKFYNRTSSYRFERALWLISRRIHLWDPSLASAPRDWADTDTYGRPAGIDFDFGGTLGKAVPGLTWLEAKLAIFEGSLRLEHGFRLRCVHDLLRSLAILESEAIVHGDLSPNNLIIDPWSKPPRPALYLIDFDAYAAPAARAEVARLSLAHGGSYGTDGYAPPELVARAECDDDQASVFPYSDRHARDMLLLELLAYNAVIPAELPASCWDQVPSLERDRRAYLDWFIGDDFRPRPLTEDQRPTSNQLATRFGCEATESERPRPVEIRRRLLRAPAPQSDPIQVGDPGRQSAANWNAWGAMPPPGFAAPIAAGPPGMPHPPFQPIFPQRPPVAPPPPKKRWPRAVKFAIWTLVAAFVWYLWALSWWAGISTLKGHGDTVTGLAISMRGDLAASASLDGTFRVWSLYDNTEKKSYSSPFGAVTCVAMSYDGDVVASGTNQGLLMIRRPGRSLGDFDLPAFEGGPVEGVALSANGRFALVLGEHQKSMRRWDLERKVVTHEFLDREEPIEGFAMTSDGERGVLAGFASLEVWDFETTLSPRRVKLIHQDYESLTIDGRGMLAFVTYRTGTKRGSGTRVRTVRLDTDEAISDVPVPSGDSYFQRQLSASEGARYIAIRGYGVDVMDVNTWKVENALPCENNDTDRPVVIAPNGRRVIYADGALIRSTWHTVP